MWKAAFRSLLQRKLRLALTMTAIVLGVGFVSGTYVLTDSIDRAFTQIFTRIAAGFDVTVRPGAAGAQVRFGGGPGPRGPFGDQERLPKELVDQIRVVPGVAAVQGVVNGPAQLLEADGKEVSGGGPGPPTLVTSVGEDKSLTVYVTRAGRFPAGPGELAIDRQTAERLNWKIGRKVKVAAGGLAHDFQVVGIVGVNGVNTLGGASIVILEPSTAQRIFERGDKFDSIAVRATPAVAAETLAQRIRAKVGDKYQVAEREEFVADITTQIRRGLSYLTTALLTFGFVALFVGAFLIFNTFTILFAQRTREFAMLRAIGAQRGQVLRVVLAEAALIGAVASVIGLGVGILTALGLQKFIEVTGTRLPIAGIEVRPRTIILSLIVGVTVTILSALVPALRATRVAPVAAIREGAVVPKARFSPTKNVLSGIFGGLGVALLAWALFGDPQNRLAILGVGAIFVFLGVALLSPLLAGPVSRVVGWPITRVAGVTGKVAQENAVRDPNRTAATAAALMIGVALISFITVFASSIRESTARALDRSIKADFIAVSQMGQIHPTMADRLKTAPQVDASVPLRFAVQPFAVGERSAGPGTRFNTARLGGTDIERLGEVVTVEMTKGRLSDIKQDEILASREFADDNGGLKVGDEVLLQFTLGKQETFKIAGIYETEVGSQMLMPLESFKTRWPDARDSLIYMTLKSGVTERQGRVAIQNISRDFPGVEVMNLEELKQEQGGNINRALTLVNALLGLSLIIAVFGIVNTLALSVIERTREIGMMRAVGVTRRQVRSMVRWESVIISVMGALLGVAVGIFFGWLLITSLEEEGLRDFVVPGVRLTFYVALAAVAGILAAVLPARAAARVDVLRAIAFE